MRAGQFKCRHCGRICVEKGKGRKYCGARECQASRKREWNRTKYASDPDYRLNQRESTAAWLSSRGGAAQYHREYRRCLRESAAVETGCSTKGDTESKGKRGLSDCSAGVVTGGPSASMFAVEGSESAANANRDATSDKMQIKPGVYKICPAGANRDAIWVELRVITG